MTKGTAFSSRVFADILSKPGRFAVILEDHFTGGADFARKDIQYNLSLREQLAEQTRSHQTYMDNLCQLAIRGSDAPKAVLQPTNIVGRILEENKAERGRIMAHLSDCTTVSQLFALESLFWRDAGYAVCNTKAAIASLVKSIGLMVSAIRSRDSALIAQALELSRDADVVIFHGSERRNLADADWRGAALSVHVQPDVYLSFYDEALMAALGPKCPDREELGRLMRKELAFHEEFQSLCPEYPGYAEDLIRRCRFVAENQ